MSHDASYQDTTHESIESSYWALAAQCAKVDIPRSRMGQLAKLCGDFRRAHAILTEALKTRSPGTYLGKVVSNLRTDQAPLMSVERSKEPEIALQARLHGWPVRKSVLDSGEPGWWVAGVLYNKRGVDVGG